jgi:hypothetical protein
MSVLGPSHLVGRTATFPADFQDFGVPFAFTDTMTLDDQLVSRFGAHCDLQSLTSRP